LEETFEEGAIADFLGEAVQLVQRASVEAVEAVGHTRPSQPGGV
jgi:hypothetical protein